MSKQKKAAQKATPAVDTEEQLPPELQAQLVENTRHNVRDHIRTVLKNANGCILNLNDIITDIWRETEEVMSRKSVQVALSKMKQAEEVKGWGAGQYSIPVAEAA